MKCNGVPKFRVQGLGILGFRVGLRFKGLNLGFRV